MERLQARNVAIILLWVTFHYADVYSVSSQSQSPTQDQYVFIHDAVLESLTCGDTQIPASGLSGAIKKLKEKDRVTILMFCALKVHLYDKQASVLAFGSFWVKYPLSDSLHL